jgi:flavodoxin
MKNEKLLTVYFSHSGNTKRLASLLNTYLNGELIELKSKHPYPSDYMSVVKAAKKEKNENSRPQIISPVPSLSAVEHIFAGFPSWCGTMPMILFSFFEAYDCSNKIIHPFITHEGSSFGTSISDIKKLNPHSTIEEGLAIRGSSVQNEITVKSILSWLKQSHIKFDQ